MSHPRFILSHQVSLFCTLGNGICDGDANIGGACEFDGGDCCQPIIDDSGCANETCLCYYDWSLHFTLAGKIKFHRKSICLRFFYLKTFYQDLQLTKGHIFANCSKALTLNDARGGEEMILWSGDQLAFLRGALTLGSYNSGATM